MYTVFGHPGCGSAIVEAALELSQIPYRSEEVDPWKEGPSRERPRALNPLLQVPALVLPDGSTMTESAAMVLHLADRAPGAWLSPGPEDPSRPLFLRWLVFLVSAIYPTFTYGDDPTRYVTTKAAQKELRERTDAQREQQWRLMEQAAGTPWFLGERRSAIDVYVWVMVRWRPRRAWFEDSCPKLAAIASALDAEPRLAAVKARNFP
jgi:GST-like protein